MTILRCGPSSSRRCAAAGSRSWRRRLTGARRSRRSRRTSRRSRCSTCGCRASAASRSRRAAALSAPGTRSSSTPRYGDRALLSEALEVGARGFVLKEAPLDDLVRAVERVAAGEAYVDPVLAGVLVGSATASRARRSRSASARCCGCWPTGCANEEIGKRLCISPETVRTHVRKAMASSRPTRARRPSRRRCGSP